MIGIWSLQVNLSGSSFKDGSALAQIVIQIIFWIAVVVSWFFLPRKQDSLQPAFNGIRRGVMILVGWYILTIADLFLHEARLQAAYGYILLYFFIAATKFAADILLVLGTHRVLSCRLYRQLGKPMIWVLFGEFLFIALIVSALYHLGSYLGNEVLWLNVADPDLTGVLSDRKDTFAIAFFVIQFVFTVFNLAGSLISGWFWHTESARTPLPREAYYAIAASAALWTRSLSELVIVLQYGLHGAPTASSTAIARNVMYGLFTIAFLALIAPVGRDLTALQALDPQQRAIENDCHNHVLTAIRDEADAGRQPPPLSVIFQVMRGNPAAVLDRKTLALMNGGGAPMAPVLEYIGTLETTYEDWRPLDRWRDH